MAYYTDAYNVGGTSYVQHLGHAAATKTGYIDGLLITGTTYNAAAELISGEEGQLSYGDAGPQIRFTDSGQKGAIIFSRFDTSSGMNAAFHFVTDDGSANAAVKAHGLIARARAMIGGNSVNNSYTLYVNGNTFQNGIIYGRHTNNYFDGKLNSSNEGIGWRINPRLGIGIDPSTSYYLYVGGPARINNDLTIYRSGTTAQNYPARIYLSVNDSTTAKTENVTIEAYNSHTAGGYGAHLYVQTASSIEIYAGDGAHSAIKNLFVGTTANSNENLWLGADEAIYLYSNGGTAANRIGIKLDAGNVLPQKAEATNDNVQNLGASGNRWAKLYIGSTDSYGSAYQPIWWDNGVPVQVTANGVITNLESTSADNIFASAPRPGVTGVLPTTNGGTGNNTFTASRLVYSNTATKLATGNIVSEGNYISKVTYLTINGDHQTTNRLQVGGQAWITGPLRIGNSDVAQTDSATNNGYAVANRGATNYIVFYGVNGDGPGTYSHTYIGERLYQSTTSTAEKSELLLFHGNDVGGTDATVNSTVAGSGPDRIRVLSQQFQVDALTSALGGTWDTVGQATNREPAFVVNGTSGIQLGNNQDKSNGVNFTKLYGHLVIEPAYNTSNSCNEGLRINRSSNGHATVALGGTKDSNSGTSTGTWYVGAYSATAGAASTFHITNNGSTGNVANSLHGGTNDGWWLYSRLFINTTTNTNWNFYVNGSSGFSGTTRQYGPYIFDNAINTNDMYFSVLGRAGTSTLDATSTTTYTSIAGDPWQRWYFFAPRITHTYATAGDSSSTVTNTYNRRNYVEIRLYSYDNSTLAHKEYFEAYRIGNRPAVNPDLTENHYYDLWSTKSLQADDWIVNRFLFADIWDYSHASSITRIKSSSKMRIYNDVNIKTRRHNGIKIWGSTVGNATADLISGTVGVMRYGDTGPRIRFGATENDGDDAEILFTNQNSAGGNASLHFVGRTGDNNEGGDLVVTIPKLVIRTRAVIGYNFIDDDYGLKIGGHGGVFLSPSGDATFEIYDVTNTTYGKETMAIQTCFDNKRPLDSDYVTNYENRCNLLLQPRGGQVYISKNLTAVGNKNYSLLVEGRTYINVNAEAALPNLESGHLVLANESGQAVTLELWRATNASWQIANEYGTLHFRNNYTTTKLSTYTVDSVCISYNTGDTYFNTTTEVTNASTGGFNIKGGLTVAKIGYFGGFVHGAGFSADATFTNSVYKPAVTVYPSNANEINFGGYYTGNRTLFFGYRKIDDREIPNSYYWGPYSKAGFTGVAETAAGTQGEAILLLGNSVDKATANNARGRIRLYGTNTYYWDIMPEDVDASHYYWITKSSVDAYSFDYHSWGTDLNTIYDAGIFISRGSGTNGLNSDGKYFSILNIPYRKPSGNTTPDWSWQLGNSTSSDNRLYYRTSNATAWNDWQEVAHIKKATAVGDGTQPVYVNNTGVVTATTYKLSATIDAGTTNRIAWYKGANEIAAGTATTDGAYLGNVSYLSINTAHQTGYRLYVNGAGAFAGGIAPTAAWSYSLGTSSLRWKQIFVDFAGGSIQAANVRMFHNSGIEANKYETTDTANLWCALSNHNNGYATGNRLAGLALSAIAVNYTTDSGTTWDTAAGYVTDARKLNCTITNVSFPVGNATVVDSGTASTAPNNTGVGYGVEVILDTAKEARTGYVDMLSTYIRCYCRTATFTIDVWKQATAAWENIETKIINNSEQNAQIVLGKGFYLNGAATSTGDTSSHFRINKIRYRLIVTAVSTGTNLRYAPSIGGFQAWGFNGTSMTGNATYPTSSRLSYCMARWNMPIMLGNFSDGNGLGSVRIPGTNIYFGDDMYYAGANVEKWTTLLLGNSSDVAGNNNHSQGRIQIYSAATGYHMINGTSTTGSYTHTLPNKGGWIAMGDTTGVGDAGTPMYMSANGVLTACTAANLATTVDGSHKWVRVAGDTMTGTLVLSKTTDASGNTAAEPALIVGGTSTTAHIQIDTNEILAKDNGTTPGTLFLQDTTGKVVVAGSGGLEITNGSTYFGSSGDWYFDTSGQGNTQMIICNGTYNATASNMYANGGIQLREQNRVGSAQSNALYAPHIGFHWSGHNGAYISMNSDGHFYFMAMNGSDKRNIYANKVYNAVWNDYAEFRKGLTTEPGRVVKESKEGMIITTKRLEAGCKVISDTYGQAMGETEECKTPIAVAGRVLVYPYRDKDEYTLGAAVCSAPNGTVDIMTREEIIMYPERIVGTVSEIPEYTEWGQSKENPLVQVNGRIWIYVR